MNIRFKNGVRTITLTKTELSQMTAAQVLCQEISMQVNGSLKGTATHANVNLIELLASFNTDAADAKPEPKSGDTETETATAGAATVAATRPTAR